MKNAAIVKAYPNRKALRAEHEALKRQIKKLLKQEEQLRREVDLVHRVTEIFEGVALDVREEDYRDGKNLNVHAVSYEIPRWAQVYPNAHNHGADWGIHMKYTDPNAPTREVWGNTGWPYADACAVARRFVAHGTLPDDEWAKMVMWRHKLDPKGTASKRRRAAFEAACMAGEDLVAGEVLLGARELEIRMRVLEAQSKAAKEKRAQL